MGAIWAEVLARAGSFGVPSRLQSLILFAVVYEVDDEAERVFNTGVVRVINQLCACTY